MRLFARWAALGLSLATASCTYLPSQGPTASEVVGGAGQTSVDASPRYLLANLDARTVEILKREPNATLSGRFGARGGAPSSAIGVGDSVSVTVWEAASGGLFSSTSINGVTAGSHSAAIPEQAIGRDGEITIPYAGKSTLRV